MQRILLSWKEAMSYQTRKDVIFVDLREPEAFERQHVEDAVCVSPQEVEQWLLGREEEAKIIFYCDHGNQSIKAARWAREHGWQAYSINGGVQSQFGL